MAYSQTYNFGTSTLVDTFVRDAFELCGIMGPDITGLHVTSALTSLNFLLSEWINKGINLFTVQKAMFQINVGQPTYILDVATVEVPEVTASNNSRLLGGTPFSSAGGNALSAFDSNPLTSCTQTAADGYISYTYPPGYTPAIYYVGIQSNTSTFYTLLFEYSYDGINWLTSLDMGKQYYPFGQIIWGVPLAPLNAPMVRIRETGGNILNIQEVYFSMPINSIILTPISRAEWTAYPNKQLQAQPTSYYLDRQIQPRLTLWPTPDTTFQTIVYNQTTQIMDVNSLNELISIPQRFMNACRLDLAFQLALKFTIDRADRLEGLSKNSYALAAKEDEQRVPLRLRPELYHYE